MASNLRPALVSTLLLTLLLGVGYPLVTTGILHLTFPSQAEGSLIRDETGRVIGSRLIGQNFEQPKYFWGRLSATSNTPYNASASGGSNFGVNNPALMDAVKARVAALKAADPGNTAPIPVDLVTASASGLDPDITPAAALYQAHRVAVARGLSDDAVKAMIRKSSYNRTFNILGEPRVNVLELNLRLDGKMK
ncbi:potassium-transporting ATPase subunit KdpC [Asticcacaulis sp. 201]|uniref:potassium-transporting ATPase subunit KdpC n=1 Tax=Asticcacaulis sp. 201 TaxID=3028787 RepID=UPI002916769B|nr:potassium-transporting ATPase subunit KdpC [Asticcacaulis sp. 201]MDV6333045.1 potassium-transporting ATPase subunit KdpC [Asticcacaulis sp. 201]